MKIVVNVLFHLFLISWHAYFVTVQLEDLTTGHLAGKVLFFFLFRIAIIVIFTTSLWKMTRRKYDYENDGPISRLNEKEKHNFVVK